MSVYRIRCTDHVIVQSIRIWGSSWWKCYECIREVPTAAAQPPFPIHMWILNHIICDLWWRIWFEFHKWKPLSKYLEAIQIFYSTAENPFLRVLWEQENNKYMSIWSISSKSIFIGRLSYLKNYWGGNKCSIIRVNVHIAALDVCVPAKHKIASSAHIYFESNRQYSIKLGDAKGNSKPYTKFPHFKAKWVCAVLVIIPDQKTEW